MKKTTKKTIYKVYYQPGDDAWNYAQYAQFETWDEANEFAQAMNDLSSNEWGFGHSVTEETIEETNTVFVSVAESGKIIGKPRKSTIQAYEMDSRPHLDLTGEFCNICEVEPVTINGVFTRIKIDNKEFICIHTVDGDWTLVMYDWDERPAFQENNLVIGGRLNDVNAEMLAYGYIFVADENKERIAKIHEIQEKYNLSTREYNASVRLLKSIRNFANVDEMIDEIDNLFENDVLSAYWRKPCITYIDKDTTASINISSFKIYNEKDTREYLKLAKQKGIK